VFKRKQRGKIGLALQGDWYEGKPAADIEEQRRNERAAERALEFTVGWFARPIYQVGGLSACAVCCVLCAVCCVLCAVCCVLCAVVIAAALPRL
jgi:hypothetical protein